MIKSGVRQRNPIKTAARRKGGRWLPFILAIVIVAVTWAAFSPVIGNDFILWDDNGYIFENDYLGRPLSESIPYFFGLHFFIGNYHPFTMTVYALLYRIAGADPHVFHTASLIVHLLNVLLVFWFIWLLSGKRLLPAAICSLFFGIHPMHVESVAWAAELKDVLYASFFIAGLIAYTKYLQQENTSDGKLRISFLAVTFTLFILSLLSKPAAIIFPLALLTLDFYYHRKLNKRTILEKIPFFIFSILFGILAIKAQREYNLLHDYYPFYQKITFAAWSLLAYIAKFIVPANLANFYPYPSNGAHIPVLFYFAPLAVFLIAYTVYRTTKFSRIIAFGCLFFLATISLELQLVSFGDAIMADRYTYVPYIGLFFIVAMLLEQLYSNDQLPSKILRPAILASLAGLSLLYASGSYARCKVWCNNESIATDLYSKYPDAPIAAHNMAAVLYGEGKYAEAIGLFKRVIINKPDYLQGYLQLANAYISVNEPDSAFDMMVLAAQKGGRNYNSYFLSIGQDLRTNRDYEASIKFLSEYIRLQKNDPTGYLNLAECYYDSKNYSSYINIIDSGLLYCPDNYVLLNHKGYSLFAEGRYKEAIPFFQSALKNNPGYEKASQNLAACYHAIDSMNVRK